MLATSLLTVSLAPRQSPPVYLPLSQRPPSLALSGPFAPLTSSTFPFPSSQRPCAIDHGEVLYLRCSISMQGCRRHLTLRTANTSKGLKLPYRIVNDSNVLLAFKQPGSAVWDLLGGGEACSYVLDRPDGERALRLYASDAAARWQVAFPWPT